MPLEKYCAKIFFVNTNFIYFVLEGEHAGLAAISVLSSPGNAGFGRFRFRFRCGRFRFRFRFNLNTYKESPRGAASGLSRCNFFRLQTSLLSLFLVQMG